MERWAGGEYPACCPPTPEADGKTGLVVLIVGELSPTPASINTQESVYRTLTGQHNAANPFDAGVGDKIKYIRIKQEPSDRSWNLQIQQKEKCPKDRHKNQRPMYSHSQKSHKRKNAKLKAMIYTQRTHCRHI